MKSKPLFPVEIPRRSRICSHKEENFIPGMNYFSVLLIESENGIVRKDFCVDCWEREARKSCASHAISHWKSTVSQKKIIDSEVDQTREERACSLLKKTITSDSPEDAAEAFVLALYLSRKKLLHLRKEFQQNDGQLMNLYEVSDTEEMLYVKRVPLSQLQIAVVQKRLAEKLRHG